MERKMRWGVLGTGRIVLKAGRAIQQTTNGIWLGVAGRNRESSEQAAELYGLERAYDGYQQLLDDPNIDAVYIALLNHLHKEWAVKAVQAGKHVLLEKPFALSLQEAQEIADAAQANGVYVVEAHAWKHHPGYQAVKGMVEEGAIGELLMMQAHFSFVADPTSSRWIKAWGGGSMYDVGCYPVAWSRYFMKGEPLEAGGKIYWDDRTEVDRRFVGTLYYSDGRSAHISSALDMNLGSLFSLMGSLGKLDVSFEITADQFILHADYKGKRHSYETGRMGVYITQAEAFAEYVWQGADPMPPLIDAMQNCKVMDALFQADRESRRIPIV